MAKPTTLPRWATADGTTPVNVTTPTSGKQDVGWTPGERPPAQIKNFILFWTYQWIRFLDAIFSTDGALTYATLDGGLAGLIRFRSTLSPASIGSNQNDYAPTGHGTAFHFRLDSSVGGGGANITGLAGGIDGRLVLITNISANPINLTHQDAASTAANRFLFQTAGTIILPVNASIPLIYDGTTARWRTLSSEPL